MEDVIAMEKLDEIIFNTAKRINGSLRNSRKLHDNELFLIEKLYLLNTPDKMMKVVRLCDWIFGRDVIKSILGHINWYELSIRRSVQLIKRSRVNPAVLKDFIIFSEGRYDDEIIECIEYAVGIGTFCSSSWNSGRIEYLQAKMFDELSKSNQLSCKLTMYLLTTFHGWRYDFLEHSKDVIQWQNLSTEELILVFPRYRGYRGSPLPLFSSLYNEIIKKLPLEKFNTDELNRLHL